MTTHAAPPSLSPGLVWLMSIATGLTVAANYYAQPLLHVIADDLGLSVPEAGSIVTAAQVSYAVGLFLLVPLGDLLDRRNLIFVMTLLAAGGLCASALAGNLPVLLAGTTVAGLFSVVAQVLVPFGATLAAPNERGKVVGTLMSGLLLGILLARTFAGLVAALGNWRLVYGIAAILMAALAFILRRSLPHHPAQAAGMAYPRLIASIAALFAQEPVLRTRAVLGALTFASFAMFWTSLAFLLSAPPFGYSTFTIGLFGLAGAAGALAAARVGPAGRPRQGRDGHALRLGGAAGVVAADRVRPVFRGAAAAWRDPDGPGRSGGAHQQPERHLPHPPRGAGPPDRGLHDELFHRRFAGFAGIGLALCACRLARRVDRRSGGRAGVRGGVDHAAARPRRRRAVHALTAGVAASYRRAPRAMLACGRTLPGRRTWPIPSPSIAGPCCGPRA